MSRLRIAALSVERTGRGQGGRGSECGALRFAPGALRFSRRAGGCDGAVRRPERPPNIMELVERTSYKRGATDFSSQVARMKAAGCDLVVLGTIIRETIGTIAEARKTGFSPTFVGSAAVYTDLIHKLGGKAMDGLYGTMTVQTPYLDEASQPIRFWATKYKTKFNDDPSVFSVYGYIIIDMPPRCSG